MFGIANQLLGVIALAIGTTYILRRSAKRVYALTTFLPFAFMAVTVLTSGVQYTLQACSARARRRPRQGDAHHHNDGACGGHLHAIARSNGCESSSCRSGPTDESDPDRDLMGLAEGVEIAD